MTDRIMRMPDVCRATGLSRSTIWRRVQRGEFPVRRALGGGLVGWLESEIDQWIAGREPVGGALNRDEQAAADDA